jgi:hypothetical protein
MNTILKATVTSAMGIVWLSLTPPEEQTVTLKTALDNHWITANFTSLGGHSGSCIEMNIKNNTPQTRTIKVEPGRRLISEIENEQDIFIVKENLITLGPGQKKITKLFGFCCESSNHSPKKKSIFRSGKLADTSWVKLAEFINKDTFANAMVQSAVWVMSNNHSPSSIYAGEDRKGKQLVEKVCQIKNIKVPTYQVQYAEGDTARPFSNRPEKLKLKFAYAHFERGSELTIKIFNTKGLVIHMIRHPHLMAVGHSETVLNLDVRGWKNGNYKVGFYAENRLIKTQEFSF